MPLSQLSAINHQFIGLLAGIIVYSFFIVLLSVIVKILKKANVLRLKEPSLVLATSIILFLGYLAFTKNVFLSNQLPFGLAYPIIGIFLAYGLWKMKKIAAIGLLLLTCALQVVYLLGGLWSPVALIYFVPVIPGLIYLNKMK